MPDPAADSLAAVTLDVDTAPWERGLQRADAASQGWADRASRQFDRVNAAAGKVTGPDAASRQSAPRQPDGPAFKVPDIPPPKLPAPDTAAFDRRLDAAAGKLSRVSAYQQISPDFARVRRDPLERDYADALKHAKASREAWVDAANAAADAAEKATVTGGKASQELAEKAMTAAKKATQTWEDSLIAANRASDAIAKDQQDRLDKLKDAAEKKAGRVASILGGVLAGSDGGLGEIGGGFAGTLGGGALGAAFGPVGSTVGSGIGAALGKAVGKAFGEELDLSTVFDKLTKLWPGFDDFTENAGFALSGIGYALEHRLEEAGDILKGGGDISEKLSDLGAQVTARIVDIVDDGVDLLKRPAGAAADAFQSVLQYVGLADEKTEKWGDTIRAIEKPFETAAGKIALGLGYVNDALAKVGATVNKYVTAPLLEAVAAIGRLGAAGERALSKITPKALGGGEGGAIEQAADRAERGAKVLDDAAARLRATAQEQLDRTLGDTGRRWEQQLRGFLGNFLARGRELNAADDKARAPVQSAGDAAIRGSKEAANAVIQASFRGGPGGAPERAAKAAEENARHAKRTADQLAIAVDELRKIRDGQMDFDVV